jgi:hypothetical protein
MGARKTLNFGFNGSKPMEVSEGISLEQDAESLSNIKAHEEIRKSIIAYLTAARNLLSGKYTHLQNYAPRHLINPGQVLVLVCPNGIVIRYEEMGSEFKVYLGKRGDALFDNVLRLSQGVLRCFKSGEKELLSVPNGVEVRFMVISPHGELVKRDGMDDVFRLWFDCEISDSNVRNVPIARPYCSLSIRNKFDMRLHGELLADHGGREPQPFIARTSVVLPLGWQCIEVYTDIKVEDWKEENAPVWAELDILSSVASAQVSDSEFNSIDTNAKSRSRYKKLLDEFKNLLDSNPTREQELHAFLQKNPFLLCPANTGIWSKVHFGDKVSDFVIRDANLDYILIEIERSTLALFKEDGHQTASVTHACNQVVEWKRYIAENLSTVRGELKFPTMRPNPLAWVVIGRSCRLSDSNKKMLSQINDDHPKTQIMTYDDVYANARSVVENLFGPLDFGGPDVEIVYPQK